MLHGRFAAGWQGLIFLLVFVTGIWAQSTGTIQGTVTDATGAAIPNVNVAITNQGTNETRTVKTDNAGLYAAPSLPAGTYRVEAQATGFQRTAAPDLVLSVSSTVRQDFKLSVASSTQTLEVTSAAPVINTASTSVGQVIDKQTVQQIPLNGRHFTDLGLLVAGTVTPPANGFLSAPLRGQGSFAINTAGNREDTVNFMINGINLNDIIQNQITFQPSINTVDEFKMDNSTYPAEYGRNSGAIVNIATRAGTNDFHGEAFEYLRNDAMDARNYFNPTPIKQSPFKRSNFGGAVGGPFWKNHTFFFFSYEGLRQRQGLTINQPVPTVAQRNAAAAAGNPVVNKLLSYVPLPNLGGSFVGSATAPVNIDQGTANISHQFSENDRINVYYALQYDFRQEPTLQLNNIPGFGDVRQSHRQIFTFTDSHVFSPTTVNEFRVGYNRIYINFSPFLQVNPQSIGIGNGITTAIGLPQITLKDSGLNFGGPTLFPQGRGDYTAVVSNTLTHTAGRHSIKFGGEYRRSNVNSFAGDTGTFSFNSFTDFINDRASAFTVNPSTQPSRIFINALGFFVQDNFKLNQRLTLDFGMRYDWNGTPTEARDRFVEFDSATSQLIRVHQPYGQNAKNFEPRVGLAFDPFGSGKTVLRAAYALQADQPIANLVTPLASNPPFTNPINFSGTGIGSSFVTLENAFQQANTGGGSLSPTTVNPNFRNAYVQQWNFNLQQQLGHSLGLMIGYFGNKGTHLRMSRNINQRINGTTRPYPSVSASSAIDPGMGLGNITEYDSFGNSDYNALWVTVTKSMTNGLQFNASYTWSKSIDTNSLNSQVVVLQNSYNVRGDRGLSDFDARQRFTLSGIYALPFKANRWVSGYEFSAVVQLQTGNPINLITTNNSYTGVQSIRPSILTGDIPTSYTPVGNGFIQYLPQATCTTLRPGCIFLGGTNVNTFGNLGRNVLIGPGFEDIDLAFQKTTHITERYNIQFRADAFNLFNHPNFGQPVRTVGSSTFGQIQSTRFPVGDAGSSRQLQVSLKFLF